MKFIQKIIALAVILVIAVGCSKERHGVDSEVENEEKNGIGAASDKDAETDSSTRNGSDSQDKNGNATNMPQGKRDADFVLSAADGGLLEVQLGELAKRNGSSRDVKEFARTMTIDHGKANDELRSLANKVNISLPNGLSEKNQQKYDELAQKKGADFDNSYSKTMVDDHLETIEKFRVEANNGQLQEIRDWAAAKIPNLEHHLEMAQRINNGGDDTGNGH